MADRTVSVKLKLDASEYTSGLVKAAAQTRGLASDVEKSVNRDLPPVFKRSGERGGGLLAQGFRSGFVRNSPVIAAAIGAALAAGAPVALAGAGVLFGGIGALAAAQTTRVRDAWSQLGRDIRDGAVADASVLVPVYEEMADKIGDAFQRMRPEIRDAFEASAPLIDRFTDGLTDAAENALPGLVRAVERGGPVIDGLATLMEDVGTGLSDFFDAMSDNSAAAGGALEALGDVLGEALPLLGELLGTGADLATVVLPPLASALGLVNEIAHALGPALPAIVTGFVGFKAAQAAAGYMQTFAVQAQYATMAMTGSADAGTKVGGALSNVGRALPGIGIGIGVLTSVMAANEQQANTWASALLAGGAAAEAARADMGDPSFMEEFTYNLTHWGNTQKVATAQTKEASAAARELFEAMSPLDQTAQIVTRATNDLELAVGKYGPTSEEARVASVNLERAQENLAIRQSELEIATRGATTAVHDEMAALVDVPGVATSAQGAIAFLGDTAKMSEEEITSAADAIVAWRAEVATIADAFVEPLTVYQGLLMAKSESEREAAQATADSTVSSSDSWRDYVDLTKVTLDELAVKLEEQLVNQENWRANIVGITQRGGAEVGQAFLDMGVEGADLAAQMANATDAEFRRMADLMIRDAEFGGSGAVAAMGAHMKVMAIVGRDGAGATARAIAEELGIGVGEVNRIAAQYGVNLAAGINPLLGALGKPQVRFGGRGMPERWIGGYTGDGGKYEPMGIVHGGEYVLTKEETARLGIDRIEEFANNGYAAGGFVFGADVPRPRSTAPYRPPISSAGDGTMEKGYDETVAFVNANPPEPVAGPGTPNGVGGLGPAAARAHAFVRSNWGFQGTIGGYANRNIAGTNVKSKHAMGKAIDVMIGRNMGLGQSIADYFAGPGRGPFGVDNVIWNRRIHSGRGWGGYNGVSPHTDHPHIDFYRSGISRVPHDGPAILHQGERVMSKEENRAYTSREFSGSGRAPIVIKVTPNLEGARITGQVAFDPSGILQLTDARIEATFGDITDTVHYAGG